MYYTGINYNPAEFGQQSVPFIPQNSMSMSSTGFSPYKAFQPQQQQSQAPVAPGGRPITQNFADLPTAVMSNVLSNMPGGAAAGFGNASPLEKYALGRYNMFEARQGKQGAVPWAFGEGGFDPNDTSFNPFLNQNLDQRNLYRLGVDTPGSMSYDPRGYQGVFLQNNPIYRSMMTGEVLPSPTGGRGGSQPMEIDVLQQLGLRGPDADFRTALSDQNLTRYMNQIRRGEFGMANEYNLPDMNQFRTDIINSSVPVFGTYNPATGHYENTDAFFNWWDQVQPYVPDQGARLREEAIYRMEGPYTGSFERF